MEKVECIIVGAGPAGAACALCLAQRGVETVVLERGARPGAKNVASFVLFTQALEHLVPDFRSKAPLERPVTDHSLILTGESNHLRLQYRFADHNLHPDAYTAYRSAFDSWFAEQATAAGAEIVSGQRVTDVVLKGRQVVGVKLGDEELRANVVVGADGIHSVVGRRAGLVRDDPSRYMTGVKEVLNLAPDTIEQRFQLRKGEGAIAHGFGYPMEDVGGLYSIYTNHDSVSIAIFGRIKALRQKGVSLDERLDRLKQHPWISCLLEGSTTREYLAHMLADGGRLRLDQVYGDGVLLCGEAGGFNSRFWIGVPPAMISGMAAAEAIVHARRRGDYRARTLSEYTKILSRTGLPRALRNARAASDQFARTGALSSPQLVSAIFDNLEKIHRDDVEFLFDEPRFKLGDVLSEIGRWLTVAALRRLLVSPWQTWRGKVMGR